MTAEAAEAGHASHDHACCGSAPVRPAAKVDAYLATYRISTMDCAVEEGEIRNALERVAGIKALWFRLGERTLGIDASADALRMV